MAMRQLRREERKVIQKMLEMVPAHARPSFSLEAPVDEMDDGGMGSLRFTSESRRSRKMGCELLTCEYIDEDQIPVLMSINLDEECQLFELDIWKVNYQPLIRYPRPEEVHIAPPPVTEGAKPSR
jgi:hypothetical protein